MRGDVEFWSHSGASRCILIASRYIAVAWCVCGVKDESHIFSTSCEVVSEEVTVSVLWFPHPRAGVSVCARVCGGWIVDLLQLLVCRRGDSVVILEEVESHCFLTAT